MANDNITMPQSTAGIQRFSQDDTGKIKLKPMHVVIILSVIVAIILLLHYMKAQGSPLIG